MIAKANTLLDRYRQTGINITLRTLYYRFVALDWFPDDRKWRQAGGKWVKDPNGTKNAEPNYKWIGDLMGDARLAGLVDWTHLQDMTRHLTSWNHYDGPSDALTRLAAGYDTDLWLNQKYRPEVWIEKDALVGVVEGVCAENDVPFFSCRGYTSLTEMWKASMRLREYLRGEQMPYIIHFGDHDPSGIDMSRDILERLRRTFMADCEFSRLALNMDQIEKLNPPPNPAKINDPRCTAYVKKFGDESWELDALDPPMFRDLIESELKKLRNDKIWEEDLAEKNRVKAQLTELAANWGKDTRPRTVEEALQEARKWKLTDEQLRELMGEMEPKPKKRRKKK